MEPNTVMRVALYCRVPTSDQNCDMRLSELREYAARRGWQIIGEFIDLGVSGAKDSRPQLDRMLKDAHARKFDAILVWELDRFARSLKMLVTAIENLTHAGVSFVSLRDNLDLSSPSGRLMLHLLGAMSEFERELIKQRVNAGIKAAKARGTCFGRPTRWVNADKITALRKAGVPGSRSRKR
jgi:DNA invertase Pin-like site-specific DNA recombinase